MHCIRRACRQTHPFGRPADRRLFAAGILLAHQDWIRSRSGAGIAIATAYKAVESAAALLEK